MDLDYGASLAFPASLMSERCVTFISTFLNGSSLIWAANESHEEKWFWRATVDRIFEVLSNSQCTTQFHPALTKSFFHPRFKHYYRNTYMTCSIRPQFKNIPISWTLEYRLATDIFMFSARRAFLLSSRVIQSDTNKHILVHSNIVNNAYNTPKYNVMSLC